MARLTVLLMVISIGILPAAIARTGGFVIDQRVVQVRPDPISKLGSFGVRELLGNPGFEKGTLPPWTSSAWMVDTINPHSGSYCAHDIGNYYIEQDFNPVPGSIIQQVTFWSRQPDQPAAQAYDFLYDDGSSAEFVQFPGPNWGQFDVTANLNRSKNLKGIRIWGYSGGGPGPDSTYVDDASITRVVDASVLSITGLTPGETIPLNSQVVLGATVQNYGPITESLYVWARIEQVVRLDNFADSIWLALGAAQGQTVQFDTWNASVSGYYRYQVTVDPADTNWQYFYVAGGTGSGEPRMGVSASGRLATPSIGRAFAWQVGQDCALRVYNSSGRLVWRSRGPNVSWSGAAVPAGVYTACVESRTYRLVIPRR